MVAVYQAWIQKELGRDVAEWRVIALMDADLMFGKRLFRTGISNYLEIGCGLALPSIAVMRLGGCNVRAFDISMDIVNVARRMRDAAGMNFPLGCLDFNHSRIDTREKSVWYANKPMGMGGGEDLLWRILVRGIRKRVSLALVPRYGAEDNGKGYHALCQRVVKRMRLGGYETQWGKLHPEMPLRWILAHPGRKREGK